MSDGIEAIEVQGPDGHLKDMTVGDLRQALKDIPDDRLVVLSSDAEGNQFHPLMQIAPLAAFHVERYQGEILAHDEAGADDKLCIVLWPMD